ncbi:MAG TPA: LysM domain-containing protein [Thermoanaerobaculia bacterium]|nr:LysM domain-containing protein [Thermoanaerobaculia bacterium]
MSKPASAPARAFAAVALIAGFLVVIVVVAGSFGGDGGSGNEGGGSTTRTSSNGNAQGGGGGKNGKAPRFYVVQNGDTLTSIAAKTGVPVDRIEALNPGVDPQILVSGDKLKLR